MTDATTEFFNELGARGHEPVLDKAAGTLRFDLTDGKRTVRWLVAIKKGDVTISRRNAKADCIVRTETRVFDGLASGTENAMASVLRGALDIQGDPSLLVSFQRLFPAAPRTAR
jgi:putative sterol carrier protein